MNLFPVSDYTDFYENTRYQLTLRLSIAASLMLTILGVTFMIFDLDLMYINFVGLIVCLTIVVLILFTKKYKIGAILFTVIGGAFTILTLLFLKTNCHFIDPLWMIIIALFAYFTLGKIAGNIAILFQFTALVYYLIFNLPENIKNSISFSKDEQYSMTLSTILCSIVIAYLIHQFLKRNAFAAEQYIALTNELKSKNELVENQNREKTAMIKEIHHRVKNNLQVITSLLRLQSNDLTNEETVKHFKEAIDRVGAMALIHNQMYQSKDLDRIKLEPYLRSLSKNILSSYTLEIPVDIKFDIKLQYAGSNLIVPVALLFNELISNSVKHAFHKKEFGEIKIEIAELEKTKITIIYHDNGDWVPPIKEDSFGIELIDTLAQQLNGTVQRFLGEGTKYVFNLDAQAE